jgi:AAA domain
MSFANVRTGKIDVPLRVLLFGVEGVGKSSFAARAPKPIFIGADSGTENLDIARLPQPESWDDVFAAVRLVLNERHDYETLVLDPLSFLEALCWDKLCAKNKWESMETLDYGKCYMPAVDEWRALLGDIERVWTKRRMNIVLLDHARVKMFKNPAADDYERYIMAMHEKSAGLLKKWCAFVLFATHEVSIHKDKQKRVRGLSDGARVVHTQWNAAWDAKNRADLPPELPLSWNSFVEAVKGAKARETLLRQQIADGVNLIADPEVTKKVDGYLKDAGDDVARLAEIANAVAMKVAKKLETATKETEEGT